MSETAEERRKRLARVRAARYRQTKKYRETQTRYRQSAKGVATTKTREQRPEVRAVRLAYTKTAAGKASHRRYCQTPKGKETARRGVRRYAQTPKGKEAMRRWDQKRAKLPHRKALNKKCARRRYRTDPVWRQKQIDRHARWSTSPRGREWYRQKAQRRRAAKGQALNTLTPSDWESLLIAYDHKCAYCGAPGNLTMDHVVPLSKNGEHTKRNIVPACMSCNAAKRATVWIPRLRTLVV